MKLRRCGTGGRSVGRGTLVLVGVLGLAAVLAPVGSRTAAAIPDGEPGTVGQHQDSAVVRVIVAIKVQVDEMSYTGDSFCTGTVVNRSWVLTAQHCLYDQRWVTDTGNGNPDERRFPPGKNSALSDPVQPERVSVQVGTSPPVVAQQLVLKQGWFDPSSVGPSHRVGDVALVKLAQELPSTTRPMPLLAGALPADGDWTHHVGFADAGQGDPRWTACSVRRPPQTFSLTPDQVFTGNCTGGPRRTENGDSGAPLVLAPNLDLDRRILVAVHSGSLPLVGVSYGSRVSAQDIRRWIDATTAPKGGVRWVDAQGRALLPAGPALPSGPPASACCPV